MHAIRAETVILPLFSVRNDRRSRGFKPLNGISNGIFTVAFCDSFDEIKGSWDTTDWLGGYGVCRRLGHTYRLTAGNLAHCCED